MPSEAWLRKTVILKRLSPAYNKIGAIVAVKEEPDLVKDFLVLGAKPVRTANTDGPADDGVRGDDVADVFFFRFNLRNSSL